MGRRSQISIIVVIGIVVLIIASLFIIRGMRIKAETLDNDVSSLEADSESFSMYMGDCLKEGSKEAFAEYGMLESEDSVRIYVESRMDECLEAYTSYLSPGFDIEEGIPVASVEFDDETVTVRVDYPIELRKGSRIIYEDDFSYVMDRSVHIRADGDRLPETHMVSADGMASASFAEGTKAYSKETGEAVRSVSLKVLDDNSNGQNNGIVVGNVIYEGLPSGTVFNPPMEMKIQLRERDVAGIDHSRLRLAYYDEDAAIWKSYAGSKYDAETNSVIGEVGHFSLISVAICAPDGDDDIIIPMVDAFKDPFGKDSDRSHWYPDEDLTVLLYLKPEYVDDFECKYEMDGWSDDGSYGLFINRNKKLDYTSWFNPKNNDLLELILENNCLNSNLELYSLYWITGPSGAQNYPIYYNRVDKKNKAFSDYGYHARIFTKDTGMALGEFDSIGNEEIKSECYDGCKEFALEALKEQFPWVTEPLINGDGIRDSSNIYCKIMVTDNRAQQEISETPLDESNVFSTEDLSYDVYCDVEAIIDDNIIGDLNNLDSGNIMDTDGFFAPPYTFILPNNDFQNGIYLLGKGYAAFEIQEDGDSCVDTKDAIEESSLYIVFNESVKEGEPILLKPGNNHYIEFEQSHNEKDISDFIEDAWSCSDSCVWTYEGLKQGTNFINVTVYRNKQINPFPPLMYARAYLRIKGQGIKLVEPSTQEGCAAADSCWIPDGYGGGKCILKGQEDSGYCCCGTGEGNLRLPYPHFETGDCSFNNYPPENIAECSMKKGCWVESSQVCVPKGYDDGVFCCTGDDTKPWVKVAVLDESGNTIRNQVCQDAKNYEGSHECPTDCVPMMGQCGKDSIDYNAVCKDGGSGYCCFQETVSEDTCKWPNYCAYNCEDGDTEVKKEGAPLCSGKLKCCFPIDVSSPFCSNDNAVVLDNNAGNNVILEYCKFGCADGQCLEYEGYSKSVDCNMNPWYNYLGDNTYTDDEGDEQPIPWKCVDGEIASLGCGDGIKGDIFEECDDGNNKDGDGCSASCRIEEGYSCNENGCYICGNGVTEEAEACDTALQDTCTTEQGDPGMVSCEEGCLNSECVPIKGYNDGSLADDESCDSGIKPENVCSQDSSEGCYKQCNDKYTYKKCEGGQYGNTLYCTSQCGNSLEEIQDKVRCEGVPVLGQSNPDSNMYCNENCKYVLSPSGPCDEGKCPGENEVCILGICVLEETE